ncbi:MAG: ABC transporter permease subunit [Dysgonamonadaceae bacterium]|nr:ABC transporter permease subunit [Dysgonamonadaceae bacterium]
MKKRVISFLYGLVIFHLLWFIAALIIDRKALPSPVEVYGIFKNVFIQGISSHLISSTLRIFGGLIISLLIGLPIGLWMACSPKVNRLLGPLLYLTYPIPKLALLPVVFLLMGIGEPAKITMIVSIIIFQIIISARDAGVNIPHENYHVLSSLGANNRQKLRLITLPAIIPDLLTAIRISIGTAISVLFFTETYGTTKGMGFYIVDAWMRISYVEMYAGILVLSFLGFLLFFLIDILEEQCCKWKL